jgi:large subunit ribosomal protein L4e
MNLLQTAPGGTFGRISVWTESAAKNLEEVFGSYNANAPLKSGYRLLRPQMTNADLSAIINSDEIQSVIRPAKTAAKRHSGRKSALKNRKAMEKLNPLAAPARKYLAALATPGPKTHEISKKRQAHRAALAKKHSKGKKNVLYKSGDRF